ncbi:MAG TPA: sigma-70 family RNA polymerase sigma factor [Armatimonadetes bacterium]|nr:sigma-70 family RNA polymerase sigma factor [Armatimonadota bacterium]
MNFQSATTEASDPMQRLLEEYARTKDPAIRDEIILQNMGMVELIANRFRYTGEPLEDLVQEGYIGLINAVDMYDVNRGVKFATYASHNISGAIQHYLRDKGKLIREPGWLHDLNQKINKVSSQLAQTLGREPTPAEIAEALDLPEEEVEEVLRTREVFRVSSLEQPLGEEEDYGFTTLEPDKLPIQRAPVPDLSIEDRLALEEAIEQLNAVEKKVIYGFFFQDLSKSELAQQLGYSCSHISHLLRRALRRLKEILLAEEREEMQRQLRSLEGQLEHYAQRVAEETIRDELTGLYNRRYILNRLDEEIARAIRYNLDISVCLLQVDNLSEYRNAYGQRDSERAISVIADILRQSSRRIDRLGRYDEERFILVLPHTGPQASVLCERLRQKVARRKFRRRKEPTAHLTLSSGIAVYRTDGETSQELVAAAERALAVAVKAGGNRTVLATPVTKS